jgi:transposase
MDPDLLALLERYERQIATLERRVGHLEAQLADRDARIADLEAQVAAAQRAAKRQATPFARRERKADPQKPGRKPGQGRFAYRAKPAPAPVTETKTALLDGGPTCGGPVQDRAPQEQFQIEIPPVPPTVTRFVTERGYCPACAAAVQSVHPEQISTATGAAGVVLGPRLKAFAADLHHRLGVSYGKMARLGRDRFGLPSTRGGLAPADARLARTARPIYEQLVALLRQSAVGHGDETGWRIGRLAAWLGVFANSEITVYEIARRRGHEVVLKILGREFRGFLVADSFRAYDAAALADWLQQKCVAHLLRNLAELLERKQGRARQFAQDVTALLREALALKAGAADLRAPEYEAAAGALEERLDRLLDPKRRFSAADNAHLAERLRAHREDRLRFLYWAELDATNNLAERELRPAVVTRKMGGGNRTAAGAQTQAILASVLATCHRQAVSILDYLVQLPQLGSAPPVLAAA